jgi:hypothetical protein
VTTTTKAATTTTTAYNCPATATPASCTPQGPFSLEAFGLQGGNIANLLTFRRARPEQAIGFTSQSPGSSFYLDSSCHLTTSSGLIANGPLAVGNAVIRFDTQDYITSTPNIRACVCKITGANNDLGCTCACQSYFVLSTDSNRFLELGSADDASHTALDVRAVFPQPTTTTTKAATTTTKASATTTAACVGTPLGPFALHAVGLAKGNVGVLFQYLDANDLVVQFRTDLAASSFYLDASCRLTTSTGLIFNANPAGTNRASFDTQAEIDSRGRSVCACTVDTTKYLSCDCASLDIFETNDDQYLRVTDAVDSGYTSFRLKVVLQ